MKNFLDMIRSRMSDDRGLFQGGAQGRPFGRVRDYFGGGQGEMEQEGPPSGMFRPRTPAGPRPKKHFDDIINQSVGHQLVNKGYYDDEEYDRTREAYANSGADMPLTNIKGIAGRMSDDMEAILAGRGGATDITSIIEDRNMLGMMEPGWNNSYVPQEDINIYDPDDQYYSGRDNIRFDRDKGEYVYDDNYSRKAARLEAGRPTEKQRADNLRRTELENHMNKEFIGPHIDFYDEDFFNRPKPPSSLLNHFLMNKGGPVDSGFDPSMQGLMKWGSKHFQNNRGGPVDSRFDSDYDSSYDYEQKPLGGMDRLPTTRDYSGGSGGGY